MKVLVDTSVWIDHLRKSRKDLVLLLKYGLVLTHDYVIGELACGFLPKRKQFLQDMNALPRVSQASFNEVMSLIDYYHLFGAGLGWIDIHLMTSAILSDSILFTLDKKLLKGARNIIPTALDTLDFKSINPLKT